MTTKDFKRLVRERQAKTGESYSIARMHVLRAAAGSPTPAAAPRTGTTAPAAAPPIVGLPAVAVWTHEWLFDGKDIAHDILTSLYDDLVDRVHSDEYRVGYAEFEELAFRNIAEKTGTAEFHVEFTAEHPSEDLSSTGTWKGNSRSTPPWTRTKSGTSWTISPRRMRFSTACG
jgi:hypothetical protein